ncbi:hypothetical protein SMSP2_01421 [Limihaloglobus sulfuriphilus]|uniref:LamG-like jellyroll fold domain-containing protein n=1 Tax=Limihaloglobus sulfuriphilus TaxID=1851148 RepID=A0A1Q2MFJ1_9BACT|nr:LamG domain-containing protein [Limihaloglobus sulfuriphilus]AQQ71057.1 hypothetical protein SMSP2_01421 [Limihaloglobus sulfuriphilus]
MRNKKSLVKTVVLVMGAVLLLSLNSALAADGSLAVYYSFDNPDALGTDDSGNGSTLTTDEFDFSEPTAAAGQVGGAVYFDGTNGYAVREADTNPSIYPDGPFSISLWVKSDDGASGVCVSRTAASLGGGYAITTDGTPATYRFVLYEDGAAYTLNTGALVTAGEWTHIALTYNGVWDDVWGVYEGDASIYANGQLVGTETSWYVPGGFRFGLGFRANSTPNGSAFFTGSVDEYAVFNGVLTDSQVNSLYTGGSTPANVFVDLAGDINSDGIVDYADLALLAQNWLMQK